MLSQYSRYHISQQGYDGHYHIRYQDYQHGVLAEKVGLASAMGIVLLIITIIVTFIQKYFFREDDKTPKENKRSRKGAVK